MARSAKEMSTPKSNARLHDIIVEPHRIATRQRPQRKLLTAEGQDDQTKLIKLAAFTAVRHNKPEKTWTIIQRPYCSYTTRHSITWVNWVPRSKNSEGKKQRPNRRCSSRPSHHRLATAAHLPLHKSTTTQLIHSRVNIPCGCHNDPMWHLRGWVALVIE